MSKARFLKSGVAQMVLAVATLPGMMIAAPAHAQADAAATAGDDDFGGIVVTARRREERLVDVPIAVTTFSGDQLEKGGAIDITDIGTTTPNITVEVSRGTNSTLSAFIRGVGQQDPVSGFEQGVGIYLDDVYLNRPQAAVLDIYDVERIEILRGPQGTLYGRNTIGGAVKYVTRLLPQEFSLKLKGNYGSYDQADGIVSVSAPIGDVVRVGASFARLSRGGFGKNLTTGEENYNKDVWAARGTLEMGGYGAPVLLRISGDYSKDNSNARGGHRLIPSLVSNQPVLGKVYDTRGGLTDPKQFVEAWGISANATADLGGGFTLRSITAVRKDDSASPIDFDALQQVDVDVPAYYRNQQFSQEFQLLYDNDGPLTGMIGAYYLDAKADTQFDVRLFTTYAATGLTAFTQANVDTTTYAIFGDFTFKFTDQLSLSAGGRYTWDNRRAAILRQNYILGGSPVFGGPGVLFGAPGTNFKGERDFNKFTPRASLSFQPNRDHNIYASYSQGFKGGGFDPRGVGVQAPAKVPGAPTDQEVNDYLSFAPETVNSYEIGYKGNLMNGGLYVALAAFRMDYKDVQIPGSVGCVVAGVPTFCGIISNAGKARFQGVEFEANARLARDFVTPGDRLNLSGSVGFIDAKYKEYIAHIPGVGPTDVADHRFVQNTPKVTASGTLAYSTPIGGGDLNINGTASYRSTTHQFEIPNPYFDQSGYMLFDANLVYTAEGGRWSLGLHAKNLANKRYKTSGYTFVASNPVTGALTHAAAPTSLPNGACAPHVYPTGSLVPTLGCEGTLTAFYGNPRQVFVSATLAF